jgi:hypothetical protein
MKKSVFIVGGIFILIIGTLFVLPVFFKSSITDAAKSTLNKQVNAKIDFEDIQISMFRSFPKVNIEIQDLTVTGRAEFENDTLLAIENARAKMSLFSLFKSSERGVEEIVLIRPDLKLIVGESDNVNWAIATKKVRSLKQSNETGAEKQKEPFTFQLDAINIKDGNFEYIDKNANLTQTFKNVNLGLKGKMYGTSAELMVDGNIEKYSVDYYGIKYLSNVSIATKTLLNVDYEKMDLSIIENELLVNRLPLEVKGIIQIPSDSIFLDLELQTKNSDFENFLALVPPAYEAYLEDVKTSGSASVSGTVKGRYYEDIYPALDIKINVNNGVINYVDLPREIKNIRADVSLTKPEGDLDLSQLKIKSAHVEIGENPVEMTLLLKNLFSDPYFDGAFVGKINFDELRKSIPMDSVNIAGTIDVNLFAKGNYSAMENENYEQIQSDGIILLDNFLYDGPNLTQLILIPSGRLDFSPKEIKLSQLNVKVGQSNFNLTGQVSNYLNYWLKDDVLKGDLQMTSSFVNLNEILRLQKKNKKPLAENSGQGTQTAVEPANEKPEKLVFDVPKNMDFIFRSNIDKAVLDKIIITEIDGIITAKTGKLNLNGLNMKMLDGSLKLTGSYENNPQNQPLVDFGLEAVKLDIPLAVNSLTGLQRMMPVGAQSQGKLSTTLKINGRFSEDFKLIPASLNGGGYFNTENLVILNSPVFSQLNGILKPEKLRNVSVEDFTANFKVNNGNIDLRPFNTKVAGQETTVRGTLSAKNLLNMRLDFNVHRDAFGQDIQNILSVIPGNQKLTTLPAGVEIKGPVDNPEVKVDLSETQKVVTKAAKSELQNSLDQLGKGLKKLFK